ncbi:DUF1648 domain-containing protein [Microbacterium abyssi]|uniref:DUF1648 domain-containing protein n=1 Tax=Microbacterium abyssi TaxID=2782166 RepID=UPI001887AFA3|nr:DUF1648 domain-containing protein [Microbacterium sp. A18JL241]
MNTPAPRHDGIRSARRAFLVVGLVAPLVFTAIATVLILMWLPDLPDRVVTHWGPGGPDRYGGPVVFVWLQVGIGVLLPLLMTIPVLVAAKQSWGIVCRFLGAVSLGTSALLAVASVASVAVQRGSDGATAETGVLMAAAFAALALFGVIGWFLQPNVTMAAGAGQRSASPLALAPGEKAAWFGTATMGRTGIIILMAAVLLLVCTTIWMVVLDEIVGAWIATVVTVLVVVLIGATLVFRVRVGSSGLLVRSIVGRPRWIIPANDITNVQVIDVNPMAEFGGWGLRIGVDGRMGIVLRTGEGLQVTRTSGRPFVVTIDDARTAAAVLTAAVSGARTASDRGGDS